MAVYNECYSQSYYCTIAIYVEILGHQMSSFKQMKEVRKIKLKIGKNDNLCVGV